MGLGNHSKRKKASGDERYFEIFRLFIDTVSSVGWAGFFIFIFAIMLLWFPSSEQKQEIIDIYLLFKWNGNYYYFIFPAMLVLLAFIAQNRIYHAKYNGQLEIKKNELKRCAKEKSKLQQRLTNKKLHHSDPKGRK
jgi:hypothetical protein